MLTRREFLKSAPALVAIGTSAPRLWLQAAEGARAQDSGRILVVIQLTGGNDGLNTIVPFDRDEYRRARPSLAIPAADVLKVGQGLGLHPGLTGLADLLQEERLAIVQGVGYPNPNRSHFESMDIWHTCLRKTENRQEGWLGRFINRHHPTDGVPAIHYGGEQQPLALASITRPVPTIRSLDQFRLDGDAAERLRPAIDAERTGTDGLLSFVQASSSTALQVSERIQRRAAQSKTAGSYPETELGQKLKAVSGLIHAGLESSVYYVQLDGFDTHSQQSDAHAGLLRQWSGAVRAFRQDLRDQGTEDRVLVMCFSEFGRRLEENASAGTDHGAAAPMFLIGAGVRPGLHGEHPSLTDLDQGDLKHAVDFRQVYATVLQGWFHAPANDILGGAFEPLQLLKG